MSKFKKTEHGSFYRIEKEGNGKFAERGDEVWVHSNGLTLDGKNSFLLMIISSLYHLRHLQAR
ncbi:MAG: hypothetical protein IPF63_12270 [Bacteroidetes bacterium]|nr:hypothetical protein [Bacteroidota bacterium]